jgi:hypothetical protein
MRFIDYATSASIQSGSTAKTQSATPMALNLWKSTSTPCARDSRQANGGAFASGTIVKPLNAHSQYVGGMIWALGAALLEKTEIDLHHARYVSNNIVGMNAAIANAVYHATGTRVRKLPIRAEDLL